MKYPGANVLEIGGGTGEATTTVLEAFGTRGGSTGSILSHYTFTNISPGFSRQQGKVRAMAGHDGVQEI